jgi:glycine/sarcosine/betaine reductase complex component A
VAEQLDREEVVVLLGTPTEDASRLYAMTVTTGDPSWAGALAGVALQLPVYHVTEDAVKAAIAPGDYDEHLALMATAMDVDAIVAAVRAVREGQG